MTAAERGATDAHSRKILDYYGDRENIEYFITPADVLIERYLGKVMRPEELAGRTILEIGAGCSSYIPLFMQYGCHRYFANDLIPERLEKTRISDPRYVELPGDFRSVDVPEPVDIVFASLVMMILMPMLDEFAAKISRTLKPGGMFLSMDANFVCPISIYRRFADRNPHPVQMFSPFRYAKAFERHGMVVEKLVPFSAPYPSVTGNWLLGTTFWLKARKL